MLFQGSGANSKRDMIAHIFDKSVVYNDDGTRKGAFVTIQIHKDDPKLDVADLQKSTQGLNLVSHRDQKAKSGFTNTQYMSDAFLKQLEEAAGANIAEAFGKDGQRNGTAMTFQANITQRPRQALGADGQYSPVLNKEGKVVHYLSPDTRTAKPSSCKPDWGAQMAFAVEHKKMRGPVAEAEVQPTADVQAEVENDQPTF